MPRADLRLWRGRQTVDTRSTFGAPLKSLGVRPFRGATGCPKQFLIKAKMGSQSGNLSQPTDAKLFSCAIIFFRKQCEVLYTSWLSVYSIHWQCKFRHLLWKICWNKQLSVKKQVLLIGLILFQTVYFWICKCRKSHVFWRNLFASKKCGRVFFVEKF